jgi:hypothetical protein
MSPTTVRSTSLRNLQWRGIGDNLKQGTPAVVREAPPEGGADHSPFYTFGHLKRPTILKFYNLFYYKNYLNI